ncbi:MAG: pilus assembly protein [Demequinaceae bacterium]|nr:pilus assembly protein [Demequinaceae bacterium]
MGRRGGDGGGAIVEFIGMALLLLVPLVYVVVGFARIQAGAYAAEIAAREAARGAAVTGVAALDNGANRSQAMTAAGRRAETVVGLTLEDFGFDSSDGDLALSCSPSPCFQPGSDIVASVEIEVGFPGVPGFVRSWLPLSVTVSAEAASPVDEFAGGR